MIGYTLFLPPGWAKVPLREGSAEVVKRIVDDAALRYSSELPKDRLIEARLELHRKLNGVVEDARRRNGIDLYIPVEPVHGRITPASFIVAKVDTVLEDGVTRQEVMTRLVGDFDFTEPVEVHETVGVRGERVLGVNPEKGIETPSRHVDYVLPVPSGGANSEWIVVSFSTVGDGDPEGEFSDLLAELFDAVMTTFRWRTE
ncbi:hypothetical protein ABT075_06180 [Streptomyces sp. NPDC002677]|uniref:hypothetical protein n=1 Tax=Streptomyces sp. NPDC002677 TaxID=3154774 RepID=UPI0033263054